MKLLHVSTSDINGGAARAAFRLHNALLAAGEDSKMLVQSKSSDSYNVITVQKKINKLVAKLRPTIDSIPVSFYKNRSHTLFSPNLCFSYDLVNQINSIAPDVVHLHWINGGMLQIEDIAKIEAPIVWTLHDMWPFTGGCHYSEYCIGYLSECGSCKVLASNKKYDLSQLVYRRKYKTFKHIKNMTIVPVSKWLEQEARISSLLKRFPIVQLPNPINTQKFSPIQKELARQLLNLPKNKKLVLFGAIAATSDPRKGFEQLMKAMEEIQSNNVELLVFGSSKPDMLSPYSLTKKIHYIGHLHDDISLRLLYSAADVTVVPSLQEAFGQTATESMACGTPVVAFAATGLLDIVDHMENGYLAKPYSHEDLAYGIETIVNSHNNENMSLNARNKVLTHYDSKVVAENYIDVYRNAIS